MMNADGAAGFAPGAFLLPAQGTDLSRWACIACDQYTSQPEYWARAEALVGDAPSALKLMLPEIRLAQEGERMPEIRAAMRRALTDTLTEAVHRGYILTERTTVSGRRIGLLGCADLEQYSFEAGAGAAIRPTEQTVRERLPVRIRIREGAPLEMGHVLLLADDRKELLLAPLYAQRATLPLLYDFELMLGGGHLRGWAVERPEHLAQIEAALKTLRSDGGGLLFAVGDGNHSLAAARSCWDHAKGRYADGPVQQDACLCPERYAMAEVVSIYDTALKFEPIHRIVRGISPNEVIRAWKDACGGESVLEDGWFTVVGQREDVCLRAPDSDGLTVRAVQAFLDTLKQRRPEIGMDYIHGEAALRAMCADGNTTGILLPPLKKENFFGTLNRIGVMPRKTFSIGEADEKRFYVECRRIMTE